MRVYTNTHVCVYSDIRVGVGLCSEPCLCTDQEFLQPMTTTFSPGR